MALFGSGLAANNSRPNNGSLFGGGNNTVAQNNVPAFGQGLV